MPAPCFVDYFNRKLRGFLFSFSVEPKAIALTVSADKPPNVFHYRILVDEAGYYFIKSDFTFERLTDLLNYYASKYPYNE